jgi:hypothetical protein
MLAYRSSDSRDNYYFFHLISTPLILLKPHFTQKDANQHDYQLKAAANPEIMGVNLFMSKPEDGKCAKKRAIMRQQGAGARSRP